MPRTSPAGLTAYRTGAGLKRARIHWGMKLELDVGDRWISEYHTAPSGQTPWRPIVLDWGVIPPVLVRSDGVPDVQVWTVRAWNGPWSGTRLGDEITDDDLGAGVTLLSWSMDGSTPTAIEVFRGTLTAMSVVSEWEVELTVSGRLAALDRQLDHLVSDDWPNAPPSSAGRLQQLVYGEVPNVPLIPVQVGLVTRLAEDITADDPPGGRWVTMADDLGAWPLPQSGGYIVQIGDTELAQTSDPSPTDPLVTGVDGNRLHIGLRGAEGSAASAWPAGTIVMWRPTVYKFIVADPDPGQIGNVRRLMIDSTPLPGGRRGVPGGYLTSGGMWSQGGNVVISIPTSVGRGRAGRRVITRYEAHRDGKLSNWHSPQNGTQQTTVQSNLAGDPIMGVSHAAWPVISSDNTEAWRWYSDPNTNGWPASGGELTDFFGRGMENMSSVVLIRGTTKTWPAGSFGHAYTPPPAIFTPRSVRVDVELAWPKRAVETNFHSVTRNRLYDLSNDTRGLECTLNGVTRYLPVGIGDEAASGGMALLGGDGMESLYSFDFGDDVDPDGAPYEVKLRLVGPSGGGIGAHVQALSQGLTGVITAPAVGNIEIGSSSHDRDMASTAPQFIFDNLFSAGMFTIAMHLECDYAEISGPWGDDKVQVVSPVQSGDRSYFVGGDVVNKPQTVVHILSQGTSGLVRIVPKHFGSGGLPARATPQLSVDRCQVAELAVTSHSYPLIEPRPEESTFLAEYGAYPTADVAGYTGAGALARPPDVIEHFLTNVAGEAAGDFAGSQWTTGAGAYGLGGTHESYRFAGLITEPEQIRAVVGRLARQCRAWVTWDPHDGGSWSIVPRPDIADAAGGSADHVWNKADLAQQPTFERSAREERVELVRVHYARDWSSGQGGAGAFADIAESGTSGARADDKRYMFDFVRKASMASDLADFYSGWDSVIRETLETVVWMENLHATRGDTVDLTLPYVGGGGFLRGVDGSRFIVAAVGLQPGNGPRNTPDAIPIILVRVPS